MCSFFLNLPGWKKYIKILSIFTMVSSLSLELWLSTRSLCRPKSYAFIGAGRDLLPDCVHCDIWTANHPATVGWRHLASHHFCNAVCFLDVCQSSLNGDTLVINHGISNVYLCFLSVIMIQVPPHSVEFFISSLLFLFIKFFFWNKSFFPMILIFFFLFYFFALDRYYYFCVHTCLCSQLHGYLLWYRISLNAEMWLLLWLILEKMPHVDESKPTCKNYGLITWPLKEETSLPISFIKNSLVSLTS